MQNEKISKWPLIAVIFTVIIKLPFLLTNHIQEDAFITWRVAQNLLDYGVMGFNGETKISASTTHLYVFISYLFNLILGKEAFITPLLIFNSLLFTLGTFFLSQLILKNVWHQVLFIFLFGILPPSIKISILGMEYGLLFFLEMSLLYFGFQQQKKWAFLLFPTLIMMTRIDTVIFLGITFLVDAIWNKKINWWYVLGGIIGVVVCVGFNWFYFNELVNNTIVAKSVAYDQQYTFGQNINSFIQNFGNFFGMIKIPTTINPFTIIVLLFEICCFIYIIKNKASRNFFVIILFAFGWVKQVIFLSQRSYFDWYYWVPQIILFIPVLLFVLEQKKRKVLWIICLIVFYIIPMVAFQTVHSIATGNGEWNYRRSIGLYLDQIEKDKNQWIFLEPAGYVPYYSKLKTIDEVGLVDKGVQEEILLDRKNYKLNTIHHRKPKYILSYTDLALDKNADYYLENYQLLKEFRIENHLQSDYPILERIYKMKPSGTDYNLYIRK